MLDIFRLYSKLFDLPLRLLLVIDNVSAIYDSLLSISDDKKLNNVILKHLVMSKVNAITKSAIYADESSSSRPRVYEPKDEHFNFSTSRTSSNCTKSK